MLDFNVCPACLGEKASNWRLCAECFEIYGYDSSEWNAWLQFKVADIEREKRGDLGAAAHEIPFGPFEPGAEGGDGETVDLITRPGGMAWSRKPDDIPWWMDSAGELLLPWAPYENDRMNAQYRKANGIYARA